MWPVSEEAGRMKRVYELGLKFQEGKNMPQAGQQNFITSKATGWHTPNLSL